MVRDGLPAAWRVPMKAWHATLARTREAEMALLPTLVKRGDRVIDVGGNFGAYACALARLGARVEVFEPNPRCLTALDAWAAHKPAVAVHPFALSAEAGEATLGIPVEANGVEHDASASLEPHMTAGTRTETVALRTLDSFGFADAQFIKIDVEGHEAQVVEGARVTIAASCPALLVEIEQRHSIAPIADTFARIATMGYAGHFLLDGRLVGLDRFDAERHQSITAFKTRPQAYHNNFLFLAHARLAAGDYRALFA